MILTTSILKDYYHNYHNPIDKISRDVKFHKLYRLTNGVYVDSNNVDSIFLAGSIISPSYISFEYALSYYGLIPERVVTITSASMLLRKTKTYTNYFGTFSFADVPVCVFSSGTTLINQGEYWARIATKEKAICDSLYKWRKVQNIHDLKVLLFVDKRIDEDEFSSCDFHELIRIASLYHCKNHELLIKLIRKEYLDE